MKLGIVGTNFISDWLLDAVNSVPEVEAAAVYSRKQETGDAFAKKHGIPTVYTDYEAFLDSDVDAVYIATPMYVHCTQALAAMGKKKHVLCEKIMAVNTREVEQMIACAKENQVVLLEAMRPDFEPAFHLVEKHLHKIGTLRSVRMEYCQYSRRYDKFREGEVLNAFDPTLSNAAIMDIGVYCIHTLVRMFGMPSDIKACSVRLHNGFEGSGSVLMQYEDMTAEAVYSKITESVTPSVFAGEDGSIVVEGRVSKPAALEIRYRDGRIERIAYEPAENNMVYEVREFVRLVKEQAVEHEYLDASLSAVRVIEEARRQNGILFPADKED